MKLYSKKYHRNVERQVHFGVGKGTHTACGQVLFSRFVLASVGTRLAKKGHNARE